MPGEPAVLYCLHFASHTVLPSRIELAKMVLPQVFYVLRVGNGDTLFCLQPDSTRSGSPDNPVWSFPLRGKLVHTLARLSSTKEKVTYLKSPWSNVPAMIAAKPLLIAGRPHDRHAPYFLEEVDVIDPPFPLRFFVVRTGPRGPILKLRRQHCFGPVHQ